MAPPAYSLIVLIMDVTNLILLTGGLFALIDSEQTFLYNARTGGPMINVNLTIDSTLHSKSRNALQGK